MQLRHVPELSISVVSHNQGQLVERLLGDLAQLPLLSAEILLTLNVGESITFPIDPYPLPVRIFRNALPRGYGANHNAAFKVSTGRFFCVLNPDLRLPEDPFPELLRAASRGDAAVVAPRIMTSTGRIEDNARQFPTAMLLTRKALHQMIRGERLACSPPSHIDWVSGVFMLFRRELFAEVEGFDERYFLYYEDVDLCARLQRAGYHITLCESVSVVHDARYDSHRRLRYSGWHLSSMFRYFRKWPRLAIGLGLNPSPRLNGVDHAGEHLQALEPKSNSFSARERSH